MLKHPCSKFHWCDGSIFKSVFTCDRFRVRWLHGFPIITGRSTTRAEDAQGKPARSNISSSVLVYEGKRCVSLWLAGLRSRRSTQRRTRLRPVPNLPHGGLRTFHQKSTCTTQLTSGPDVVQVWSRNPQIWQVCAPSEVHGGERARTQQRQRPPPVCPLSLSVSLSLSLSLSLSNPLSITLSLSLPLKRLEAAWVLVEDVERVAQKRPSNTGPDSNRGIYHTK